MRQAVILRPPPSEAVRIATEAAPHFAPARLASGDCVRSITTRLRDSTLAAVEVRAKDEGSTLKQVIGWALADALIAVAATDPEDGTPYRRAA